MATVAPTTATAAAEQLAVTFVAVGQGDAAVYRGPCGQIGVLDVNRGGVEEVLEDHLEDRDSYQTLCDPRLNARQSLDLVFEIASLL
ncbi:MAG: 3-deoxy-7-phosphoheptulonate synthase [Actinobacteria bacterium]|nr:3-deoxy-7-phosphoheptulonate synthase [Actinomycetota bacterium]